MINFKSIKQKKRITLLLLASFSVVLTTWSQNRITGVIKDVSGELPGVSVSVEGNQSVGTISDTKGEFTIVVPETAKNLVFKFIGKETKVVPINDQKEILVLLEDQIVNLNEVIAVGYGTVKKRDLTGAVSVINPTDFKNVKALSVGDDSPATFGCESLSTSLSYELL